MNRAYIVDFSEPGQVADAYDHYFSNFAFLLNTPDEIKLFTQIRIRFNFPDGNGTTVVARVVSILPDSGYGLQLADTSVTHWVLEKAKEYADRRELTRTRVRAKEAMQGEPAAPTKEDLTTRRIDPPTRSVAPTPGARYDPSASAEEAPSIPPGTETKPVAMKRSPVETPPAQPAGPDVPSIPTPPIEGLESIVEKVAPSDAELRQRVAELDKLVADAGANPGETLQAAPHQPLTSPVASPEPVETVTEAAEPPPAEEAPPQPELATQIAELTVKQKKKLAISGDVEERRLLMADPDLSLHLWVLKNPGLTEAEVVVFAANPNLSPDALNFLLQNRRWGTSAAVATQLVNNPSTPPEAIPNLLTVLPQKILKALSERPGVRHLVARQARRVLMERSQG